MEKLIKFFKDEEGATAVEYGLMVRWYCSCNYCCRILYSAQISVRNSIQWRHRSVMSS